MRITVLFVVFLILISIVVVHAQTTIRLDATVTIMQSEPVAGHLIPLQKIKLLIPLFIIFTTIIGFFGLYVFRKSLHEDD